MEHAKIRKHAIGLVIGLCVQYLLGIITNLYVAFPENEAAGHMWEFARTQLFLMTHIIWGMLLLIGSIALLVRAIRAKDRTWKISAGVGLGAILLSIMSGSEFVSTQNDQFSLAMAVLFIVALLSYGWGVYKTK